MAIKSKMLMGSPILMGDSTVPGVRIHKEVRNLLPIIFDTCKKFGLDYYPTYIEFMTYDEISEIASYGGFPVRYPHWSFGMEYEGLSRGYEYGAHRISEMVVNCCDPNTRVLTDKGSVVAKEVKVGDKIHGAGGWRKVVYQKTQPRSQVMRIVLNGMVSETVCTPEHKWLCDRGGKKSWVETKNLLAGDVILAGGKYETYLQSPAKLNWSPAVANTANNAQDNSVPVTTPARMTKDLAELMGILTGEGSVGAGLSSSPLSVRVRNSLTNYHKHVCKLYDNVFGSTADHQDKNLSVKSILLNNRFVVDFLTAIGVSIVKNNVPWTIWSSSNEYRASYLRGVFDANGRVRRKIQLDCSHQDFASAIQLLLLEMGIKSVVYVSEPNYIVCVEGQTNIRKFAKHVGFSLGFKSEALAKLIRDNEGLKVKESPTSPAIPSYEVKEVVELSEERETIDIALDHDDHDFLANGLVSHNTNPCVIYCLDSNTLVDNIDVICHALGHNHFFKNNIFFSATDTNMMDKMANHASRIRRYMGRWGREKVTEFIDHCLRLNTLIDPNMAWKPKRIKPVILQDKRTIRHVKRLKHEHNYMDYWINPEAKIRKQKEKIEREDVAEQLDLFREPTRDVFGHLKDHAPLKPWQQDIISMLYEEAMYFAPQRLTKATNEGFACLLPDSLVFTDNGFVTMEQIVSDKMEATVFDDQKTQKVVNWFKFENKQSYKIKTKRGYELSGSATHRIYTLDGWKQLQECIVGDKLTIAQGGNLWTKTIVPIHWNPFIRPTIKALCEKYGVSYDKMKRFKQGNNVRGDTESIRAALAEYNFGLSPTGGLVTLDSRKHEIKIPKYVTKELASFLGFLTGDGHISEVVRTIGFTNGEEILADMFASLTKNLFGLDCNKKWDDSSLNGRWRVSTSSKQLEEFLKYLGLPTGVKARIKKIPEVILKSPKYVVSAFLRAYFDAAGCVPNKEIILSTSSPEMAKQVQIILLNYGILSSVYKKEKDNYHLCIGNESIKIFYQEIGFNSPEKQKKLCAAVYGHPWVIQQDWTDEIVSIEDLGEQTVYDISVENTHRYVAQGFVNHNSWVDYKIMCGEGLCAAGQKRHDCGIIEYARHKMQVLGGKYSRNPYKMGFELLMDIEDRWNKGRFGSEYDECKDMRKKLNWNTHLNDGKQKVFDVVRHHNDATLIAEFFTPEFCDKHEWYEYKRMPNGEWKIVNRDFKRIKKKLLQQYTNGGLPDIRLSDPNHLGKGWYFLQHVSDGRPLYDPYARETMVSIWKLWKNNVILATKDATGREFVYSCEGPDPSRDVTIMTREEYESVRK